MVREEFLRQVGLLRQQGKSIRAIAAELGVNRGRVARGLKALSAVSDGRLSTLPRGTPSLPTTTASAFVGRQHEPLGPAGSLIGTTLVGRERELSELRAWFDDAVDGNGRLVMVVGEPGIGKTKTAEELATLPLLRQTPPDCLVDTKVS